MVINNTLKQINFYFIMEFIAHIKNTQFLIKVYYFIELVWKLFIDVNLINFSITIYPNTISIITISHITFVIVKANFINQMDHIHLINYITTTKSLFIFQLI